MKIAKEDRNGQISNQLKEDIDLMMSKDERNQSYSVEVDVSQLIWYDINDSIHYVSSVSSNDEILRSRVLDQEVQDVIPGNSITQPQLPGRQHEEQGNLLHGMNFLMETIDQEKIPSKNQEGNGAQIFGENMDFLVSHSDKLNRKSFIGNDDIQNQSLDQIYGQDNFHQSHDHVLKKPKSPQQFNSLEQMDFLESAEEKSLRKSISGVSKKLPGVKLNFQNPNPLNEELTSRNQLRHKRQSEFSKKNNRHSLEVPSSRLTMDPSLHKNFSGKIFQTDQPKLDPDIFGDQRASSAIDGGNQNINDTFKTVIIFDGLSEIPQAEKQVDETQKTLKN